MWIFITFLHCLGLAMTTASEGHPWYTVYAESVYEEDLKSALVNQSNLRYYEGVEVPLKRWREAYKTLPANGITEEKRRAETERICRHTESAIKALAFLHVNSWKNCRTPKQDTMHNIAGIKEAFREIETFPKWLPSYQAAAGTHRQKYVYYAQWLANWAASLNDWPAFQLSLSIKKLRGKTLMEMLGPLRDLIEHAPNDSGIPPIEDADPIVALPSSCLLDGAVAANEFERDWISAYFERLEADTRASAAHAGYCATQNLVNQTRGNETFDHDLDAVIKTGNFQEHAEKIIRHARVWREDKLSLLWSTAIEWPVRRAFPIEDIDERNYTRLAANLTRRLSSLGPENRTYTVAVFPSSHQTYEWRGMRTSADQSDQKSRSIVLPDIHGITVFIARFTSPTVVTKKLAWLYESKTRGKLVRILQEHGDEDADVLLDRIRKAVPDLINPDLHFSSALLLRHQPAVFKSDQLPHSVNGEVPYETVHTETLGRTKTRLYLYLFP